MIRRDSGNCASAPPRGESGGTAGWSCAAAQTGQSGACSVFKPWFLPVVLNTCFCPVWAGGCVFPLPPKPLPERHAQQPAEDLLPRWSQPVVHAAPASGPGEGVDHQDLKFQQYRNKNPACVFDLQEPDSPTALGEPVSRMQLVFDEEDEEGREVGADQADAGSRRGVQEPETTPLPQSSWELGQNSHLNQVQAPASYSSSPWCSLSMCRWWPGWAPGRVTWGWLQHLTPNLIVCIWRWPLRLPAALRSQPWSLTPGWRRAKKERPELGGVSGDFQRGGAACGF